MPFTNDPKHQTLDVINIMEILVLEEVDDQMNHQLSPQLARQINRMEVATYALNRVPALYASSQKGVYYQVKRAKRKYQQKIADAVSRGIAKVLREPLRNEAPLTLATISKVTLKLDLRNGDRNLHPSTFAESPLSKEFNPGDYKPDPRDLAYQAARELRATLEAKLTHSQSNSVLVG